MAPFTCPHCGVLAEFTLRHSWNENHPIEGTRSLGAWTCASCRLPITGTRHPKTGHPGEWWPRQARTPDYPDVPEHVAEDAKEAHTCHSVGAIRAAVVMSRRAVQSMAVHRGATPRRRLRDQIDELAEKQVVTPSMKDVAHEIRLTGNEGAHQDANPEEEEDILEGLTPEETEDVLSFMDTMIEHVYQVPARVERLRERRAAREG